MKTLLYATDCSQTTATALKYAHRLSIALKAKLHVLHVYDLPPFLTATVRSRAVLEENFAKEQLAILNTYCDEHLKHEIASENIHPLVEKNSSISEAILDVAKRLHTDLVLVGIKDPNTLRGFFTHNIANQLMKELQCPLLILPDEFFYHGLSTLLYATDFEESDIYAIEKLVDLAKPYGALIKIVHIPKEGEYNVDDEMERFKKKLLKKIDYPEIVFSARWAKDIALGIHEYIDQDMPEMLIMMSRDHYDFWDKLFHKDLVKTMEEDISIPLLVFKKENIQAEPKGQQINTLAFG